MFFFPVIADNRAYPVFVLTVCANTSLLDALRASFLGSGRFDAGVPPLSVPVVACDCCNVAAGVVVVVLLSLDLSVVVERIV